MPAKKKFIKNHCKSRFACHLSLHTPTLQYRTRGQKQRHEENEMVHANRRSAHIEYIKPNTKVKMQRQKVPDDEDIDMAKIVKDDKPRHDRQRATETVR